MFDETRYCEDIGMWAIDRSIPESCDHASDFCKATCYNMKLFVAFPRMLAKDVRNEQFWAQLDGKQLHDILKRKRSGKSQRIRLMTRGEAFKDFGDVYKVKDLLESNPDRLFWIPTRAWRSPLHRALIQALIFPIANARLLASTDPTTSSEEWAALRADGWNTMFYGDDTLTQTPNGDRMFRCPKTWKGLKGHCDICKAGCFKPLSKGRVDVHLSQH